MPRARGAGGGIGASGRTRTATNHGGSACCKCLRDLVWADKVDMRINCASGDYHAFASNHFRARTDDNRNAWLDIRVTCFTYARNQAILDANICFNNPGHGIDNQGIGNHGIGAISTHTLALAHAVTDDFTATEFHFFTEYGKVLFDFKD